MGEKAFVAAGWKSKSFVFNAKPHATRLDEYLRCQSLYTIGTSPVMLVFKRPGEFVILGGV